MQYSKFTYQLTLIALLVCTYAIGAFAQPASTVRIVDNNFNAPTGDLIYATIQQAVDASIPGDIIYIQPSPTKYGDASTYKRLHFKGIGFDLDKDQPHISHIGDITLINNVDNTQNASGSTIEGLQLDYVYINKSSGTPSFNLSDISVRNCYMSGMTAYIPTSNVEISDNRITSSLTFYEAMSNLIVRNNLMDNFLLLSGSPSSVVVSNNIIYGTLRKESQGDNLVIQNNNFIGAKNSSAAFSVQMMDAIVANNIFYGRTPSISNSGGSTSTNFQRNIFTNNLSYETGNDALPPSGGGVDNSGDGNIMGSSPLFANVLLLNTWSADYDFTLQGGSPAIDAGSDGTDIGISGGPYADFDPNFSLITTRLPTIQIFNTSTVINPGDNLEIRVQAKTN